MPTSYGRATKATFETPELEDNYYRAQIADIKDSTSKWEGVESPQYMVKFELLDEVNAKGDPVSLMGFLRIPDGLINDGVLNENSKLYEFLRALGYTDEDLEVEPDSWQGEKLRIQVKNKKIEAGERKGQVVPGWSATARSSRPGRRKRRRSAERRRRSRSRPARPRLRRPWMTTPTTSKPRRGARAAHPARGHRWD